MIIRLWSLRRRRRCVHKTQRYGAKSLISLPYTFFEETFLSRSTKDLFLTIEPAPTANMPLTRHQADAIRDWVPYPSSLSLSVASPTIERFLVRRDPLLSRIILTTVKCQWAGSPTPSDSISEGPWTRGGLSYLCNDDLAEG